jgi:hypothetical protein
MATRTPPEKKADGFEQSKPKAIIGRSTDYTPELGFQICERMVEGNTLKKICLEPDMPDRSTIFRWLAKHPEFLAHYKIAIELHADWWADYVQQIADDPSGDYVETESGKLTANWENVQRSRLRVDTIKWRCAKLHPKKYSERYQMSGPNEQPLASEQAKIPLLPHEVTREFAKALDRLEADMGLPAKPDATAESRLKAILDTGQPIPPELYDVVQHHRKNGGLN